MRLEDWTDEKCVWCGGEYETTQPWQKYCSIACKEASRAAFNKQVRRSILDALKCECCGTPMPFAQRSDRRFCSKSCTRKMATVAKKGPLELVRCQDCGNPIPGVVQRNTKRCPDCARAEYRRQGREYARQRRAAQR